MIDIDIRIENRAGRITLHRPEALNALTYDMVRAVEAALDEWRSSEIDLILLDAEGDRAFCAGGDIADMYDSGQRGDLDYGRQFWRDEYRMNAKLFEFPKPVVSFLQGFTMGGGVGLGCHGSHRIVGESSKIAMPECGIGLVPDVGGSLILARAPGRLGEFCGVTSFRMAPADAILVGFADYFIPEAQWSDLKADLVANGNVAAVDAANEAPPPGRLAELQAEIDHHFAGATLGDVLRSLKNADSDFAGDTLKSMSRNAPLAMACALQIVRRLNSASSIRHALDQEFRYTHRAVEQGDFIEGIRAAIIDKDRDPAWAHEEMEAVSNAEVSQMLMPLRGASLNWEGMP